MTVPTFRDAAFWLPWREDNRWVAGIRGVFLLLALLWTPSVLPFAIHGARMISYPHAVDREEGFVALQGMALSRGLSIYPRLNDGPPWLVGNYPPVYPMLTALGCLVGLDPMASGRAVSYASGLLVLIALGVAAARATGGAEIGMLAAARLAGTYDFAHWWTFARVDMTALAFTAIGLLSLTLLRDRRQQWMLGICAVLAFFSRQTELFLPLAFCIALAMADRRSALRFAVATGAAAVGVMLLLVLLTGGEYWRHTVNYNANMLDWPVMITWARHLLRFEGPFMIGGAIVAIMTMMSVKEDDGAQFLRRRALGLFAVLSLLTLVAAAKRGSAPNYLLPLHLAWTALVFVELLRLFRQGGMVGRMVVLAFAVAMAAPLIPAAESNPSPFALKRRRMILVPGAEARAGRLLQADATVLMLKDCTGMVLGDDAMMLHRAGFPVHYQPFIMSTLAAEGAWDQGPLLRMLEDGTITAVASAEDFAPGAYRVGYTEEMAERIRSHYVPKKVSPSGVTLFEFTGERR